MTSANVAPMRIIHTMYRVLDIDRSVDWYGKVFGWEIVRQTHLGDTAVNTFVGPPGEDILELTMNYGRTEPYAPGDAYGHIAVLVPDLDALLARLEPLGIKPEKPPFVVRENGPRLCFIRDPDNYRIELTEPPPAAAR
jgi:lactoylglutathione lyase